MKDILKYKHFIATVHYSTRDETFFGKIEGINDLVTFEGESVKELKEAFMEAVDDYIDLCKEIDKKPLKSFKGSFNIRINPKLHEKVFKMALEKGLTLNQFIKQTIEKEITSH